VRPNLRQKLAEARRRIGYFQKRSNNFGKQVADRAGNIGVSDVANQRLAAQKRP